MLQTIFCLCVIETTLLCENVGSVLRAGREWFDMFSWSKNSRTIKQLLNAVIAKHCDLSVSCRSVICLSLRLREIIDLVATDKSRYFAQPRPIIVNYLWYVIMQNEQFHSRFNQNSAMFISVTRGRRQRSQRHRKTPFSFGSNTPYIIQC